MHLETVQFLVWFVKYKIELFFFYLSESTSEQQRENQKSNCHCPQKQAASVTQKGIEKKKFLNAVKLKHRGEKIFRKDDCSADLRPSQFFRKDAGPLFITKRKGFTGWQWILLLSLFWKQDWTKTHEDV